MSEQKKYEYRYPHAALTADCVVFGFTGRELKVLLIERGLEPYKGMWALPGGFMRIDETIEQTARRELQEETGVSQIFMEQFKVFSTVNRDPRERVVTVAFLALVRPNEYNLLAGDDASDARWFNEEYLPPMAFDHAEIISAAREYLKEVLRIRPLAFRLLDEHFSMSELQRVYEVIEGCSYDRRNFQRKALQAGVVREIDPYEEIQDTCCGSIKCTNSEYSKPQMSSKKSRGKQFSFNKDIYMDRSVDDDSEASISSLFSF